MKVAVLGAGAWGTALAKVLHSCHHEVTMWGHDAAHLESMRLENRNERYLPGITLPSAWQYEPELRNAVHHRDCVIVAVPSKALREVTLPLADFAGILVSVTKGIEFETGLTMSSVLRENAPRARIAALSGPTLALEVAQNIPTATVVASHDDAVCRTVQKLFHCPSFRVYTSSDLLGVELGGALKNVVAIAAGAGDGLGFGDNSKAALITRGIVEMGRLGEACGARVETFSGLSGLGDLTVTCFSRLSRNRGFGEKIGRGEPVAELLRSSVSVVEGYPTARSARQLAQTRGLETPIIDEVYACLYEGKNVARAVMDLTQRASGSED